MKEINSRLLIVTLVVLCTLVRTTLSRHHYGHHRMSSQRRNRRQGARLYLPGNYVIPEGEGSGVWGPWGEPTPCSRSCGGGVASQERICLEVDGYGTPKCTGGSKKYFSCNTQDCPDTSKDFREEQCSEYDKVDFRGATFSWVPYTKAPNPCELNCMPRGERFFYRHKTQVVDGTKCNSESLDVCVDGKCMPVGCDMMLGSDAREDKCRICRGNGTTCTTINGENDDQNLRMGYNDILLIPAGATSILIEEIKPSYNYLAVRPQFGKKYYLNGNYQISFSTSLNFAGAEWYYERNTVNFATQDLIRCLGPTTEAVYISLLLTDKNVGVKYEYSIPSQLAPLVDSQYIWTHEEFTPCSATCGGGFQTRKVSCATRNDLEPVDDQLCDPVLKPVENQTCATNPCAAQWIESPWGECNKPCGEGGTQSRQVYCQKIIVNGLPSLVSDDECIKVLGEKPALHRKCNEGSDCPMWHKGPWLPCDHLCGEGKQKRNITCYKKVDGKIEKLDDSVCTDRKPDTEKSCMIHPCEGVDWVLSDWSGCDSCLSKESTRTAQCVTKSREIVSSEFCSNHPTPELKKPCDVTELPPCDIVWYASQWSNCSTKCGVGQQSRRVFCGLFDGKSIVNVDDSRCKPDDKYNDTKPCTVEAQDCPAEWHASPWTACSKDCGGGDQTRTVYCLKNNKTVATDQCGGNKILDTTQRCNTGPCDEDQTLSATGSTQPMYDDDLEECPEDYDDYPTEEDDQEETKEDGTSTTDMMFSDSPSTSWTDETGSGETSFGSTLTLETGSGDEDTDTSGTSTISTESTGTTTEMTGTTLTETTGTETTPTTLTETTGTESSTTEGSTTVENEATETTGTDSSTTDSSTTDSSTTDSSTTDSSTTDSSTTDLSTTDSSTTDMSTTDSSTTDMSTTDSSTTDMSTTDSSTTDSSTTDSSTTDSSTTDSSTTEVTTEFSTSDTSSDTEETGSTVTITDGTTVTETTDTEGSTTDYTETTGTTETQTTNTGETEETGSTTESTTDATATTESVTGLTTESEGTTSEWTSPLDIFTDKPRKCRLRKKRPPKCAKSEFGCCFDNSTAATGPFDEGCPHPQTCSEARHGCCPDGVSAAEGPHGKGCVPPPCKETLFGCCKSDGKTPSQGNNQEGCPPPEPACKKSKFKCCADNKTPAKGKNKEGCPETSTQTPKIDIRMPKCEKSKYGCCPDGETEASSEDKSECPCREEAGCDQSCNVSTFGCCPDSTTPAHGPLHEGCCLNTEFGCCHDNIQPATGPNMEGCDCQMSPYKCCPDNTTAAKGFQNEGCPCETTTNGCCPDKKTAAKGPNYEGCPCHTYQFGCCDDGETPAKGPQNQGCRCQETQYGCCSDDITAATGPNKEGCDCSTSKYGCCPDGVSEASGDKFQGCADVIETIQEHCGLDKDTGTCSNYSVRWYYDTQYGGCSRFWYGGCEGNKNNFMSQDECQDACVQPKGKDVCKLPKIKGACQGYDIRWYFDSKREQCGQFIYGGCLGNSNNFETRQECQSLCEKVTGKDKCQQSIDKGPCQGTFVRWGYSAEERRCTQFVWGGCEGNANRFSTEAACINSCDTPGTLKNECNLELSKGNCNETHAKWYYNNVENKCLPYYYSGCDGNANSFRSEPECQERCPAQVVRDVCALPASIGECADYREKWYYNTADKRCRQFYYGGCGGNGNNFATESQCKQKCDVDSSTPTTPRTRPTEPRYTQPRHTQSSARPQQQPFNADDCYQAADPGSCSANEEKWSYDSNSGQCQQFVYTGCGGNRNNFPTREHCEYFCAQQQDVCQLPMRVGSCNESYSYWYYETDRDTCSQFEYSGCEGNGNRFSTREECEGQCRRSVDEPQAPVSDNVCEQAVDPGPCSGRYVSWYYNINSDSCAMFVYGGCEGNNNRFESQSECETQCRRHSPPTQTTSRTTPVQPSQFYGGECDLPPSLEPCGDPIPAFYYDPTSNTCAYFEAGGCSYYNRYGTEEECQQRCIADSIDNEIETGSEQVDRCTGQREECSRLSCPYGRTDSTDINGCPHCSCVDLCENVSCMDGERCVVNVNYNNTYSAECRPVKKDGQCPVETIQPSDNEAPCHRWCYDDADCEGNLLCCTRGCKSLCLQPSGGSSYTTTLPDGPRPPIVEESLTDPEVVSTEGGVAVLRCVVTGNPPPTITWERGAITIDGKTGRYRLLTDGSLQIVSLYRNDSGVYVCVANNGIGRPIRKEITLTVGDPVELPAGIEGDDADVVGEIGQELSLRCAAYGYPPPDVQWTHGMRTLVPYSSQLYEQFSDHSLLIRRLSYETLGIYVCEAYNSVNDAKPDSWTVTVRASRPPYERRDSPYWLESDVLTTAIITRGTTTPQQEQHMPDQGPPNVYVVPVTVSIDTEQTQFPVGSNLTLPCNVDGYPEPSVIWYKDGEQLNQTDRIYISEVHRLTIYGAEEYDSGIYMCSASNQYSEYSASIQISVQGVYIPSSCTDNPYFANCKLIVNSRYCRHEYYSRFCCRSCSEAGQITPDVAAGYGFSFRRR